MAFGDEELQEIVKLFKYYQKKDCDFGYQDTYEKLYVDEFVKYMGGKGYADAVCTGTAALFVAIASLQLPPGSHVIVSPVTDPGTISAIILNQLVPVLADSSPNSLNMGVQEFKEQITEKTRAVVVVHVGGKAAEINLIMKVADELGIRVIEDCSQAHGAKCMNQKVGTFGDIAAFSTMYRKAHSTGGCGGVIFTKNEKYYDLIRSYADRGKPFFGKGFDEKNPGMFLFPALNFNLDEISCAIGRKSLTKLDNTINKRLDFLKKLAYRLTQKSNVCKLQAISQEDSPFFHPIFVDISKISCSKIEFAQALQNEGITLNPHYLYIVKEWQWVQPYLSGQCECINAIEFRNNSFNLLFNENYGDAEIESILEAILRVEEKYRIKGARL
jgi:dTDP-4-amino-4,6-dideoxygalactose transaminase